MRLIFIILLSTLSCVSVRATHLVVGNVADGVVLANHTIIVYRGMPMMKRSKYFFYSSSNNEIIRGIKALDLSNTKSSVKVTAGGIGYAYANLRFDGERGAPIVYGIGVYIDPYFK